MDNRPATRNPTQRPGLSGGVLPDTLGIVVVALAALAMLAWMGAGSLGSPGLVGASAMAAAVIGGLRGHRRYRSARSHPASADDPEVARLCDALDRALRLDPLTGLPNRTHSLELLEARCAGSGSFELFLLGLDRFSEINDILGHDAGDELLRQVQGRLRGAFGASALCGRIGGDEFMVLVEATATDGAGERCRRVSANIGAAFELAAGNAYVTASIGVARFPSDADDARQLLRRADLAMQAAKRCGRQTHVLFEPGLQSCSERRLALENDLRVALDERQFELYMQPKFEVASGLLSGAEVLLRWRHPERGLVSPSEFIPLLEDTGLILPVGRWVLLEAMREFAGWQARVADGFVFAVNLSPRQFQDPALLDSVRDGLARHGIRAGQIELEITESALMQDADAALRVVDALRGLGVRIAVDDFGTGYSSLSYLRRFRPETVKLDRSFILGIADDPAAHEFVRRIVELSLALGQTVVAEGVETERELAQLAAIGCPQAQGYLYSRPLPAGEFAERFLGETA